jgi:hypothetical protein
VSRHYYDLHRLIASDAGRAALEDGRLGQDCVRHTRMFFDRPDFDLATARPGSFAVAPSAGMMDGLRRDYANATTMIFGAPPQFEEIVESARRIEAVANAGASA